MSARTFLLIRRGVAVVAFLLAATSLMSAVAPWASARAMVFGHVLQEPAGARATYIVSAALWAIGGLGLCVPTSYLGALALTAFTLIAGNSLAGFAGLRSLVDSTAGSLPPLQHALAAAVVGAGFLPNLALSGVGMWLLIRGRPKGSVGDE